jgi:hypothetical protein
MKKTGEESSLGTGDSRTLRREYLHTKEIVQTGVSVMLAAIELVRLKPERIDDMIKNCERVERQIESYLTDFQKTLERALQLKEELDASIDCNPAHRGTAGAAFDERTAI